MDWAHDYFERGYAERWSLGPPTDDTERDAEALWRHLRLTPGAPVLDVGCGHGRYALVLAKRGARVTGLDFASTLLDRALDLANSLRVTAHWIRGDMRSLPIRTGAIQAALLFDAFGFFESEHENHLVIRELARVLAPTGRLALKVANAEPILAGFRANDQETRGEATIEIVRSLLSDPPRLIEDVVIRQRERMDRYQRRQRLYRQADVLTALESAGFFPRSATATLQSAPFDANTSPSMVIVAERQL